MIFSLRWLDEADNETEVNYYLTNIIETQIAYEFEMDEEFDKNVGLNTSSTIDFLKKISPKCKDLILWCKWEGVKVNCNEVSHTRYFDGK